MYNLIKQIYHSLLYFYARKALSVSLRFVDGGNHDDIVILVDRLEARSGGVRNIARIANAIPIHDGAKKYIYVNSASSVDMTVFKEYGFEGELVYKIPSRVKNYVSGHWLFAIELNNIRSTKDISWTHIIQDYDEYFFPISSKNYLASLARKLPERFIVSGKWMRLGDSAIYLPFPVDMDLYKDIKISRDIDILFFHKPEMPRRCAYLLERIALILAERGYRIGFYGSNFSKYIYRSTSITHFGAPKTLNELVVLYNRARIGVSFNSTNPSLIPFEQAACGCLPMSPGYVAEDSFLLPFIHHVSDIDKFCSCVTEKLSKNQGCLTEEVTKILEYYIAGEYICDTKIFSKILSDNLAK